MPIQIKLRPVGRWANLLILLSLVGSACVPAAPAPTAVPAPTATAITPPAGWRLLWHDEFDGTAVDVANWTYDLGTGNGGWGNGEAQEYTARPENVRLENGLLIIEARKEQNDKGGVTFTSARLKTQGLQTFQYGRIEARLKVPVGAGTWPAFWMLGENITTIGWPDCGEIDIMEYVGREPDLIMGTLHGPGYSGAAGLSKWNRQTSSVADDFHVFAIEWETDEIRWYYDGIQYHTVTRADVGERKWAFDQPFFIILNLALGGTLGGLIHPKTAFPVQLNVDYVRVYQKP